MKKSSLSLSGEIRKNNRWLFVLQQNHSWSMLNAPEQCDRPWRNLACFEKIHFSIRWNCDDFTDSCPWILWSSRWQIFRANKVWCDEGVTVVAIYIVHVRFVPGFLWSGAVPAPDSYAAFMPAYLSYMTRLARTGLWYRAFLSEANPAQMFRW